jgi:hypothetical protein
VSRSITRSRQRRYLAIAPIAALVAAGLTTGSTSGVASASPAADRGPATGSSSDDYMNYVAPQVEAAVPGDDNVKGAKKRLGAAAGQDALALLGGHAVAKAVAALAPQIAWIVGAFRHRS